MLDLRTLQVLRERKLFNRLRRHVPQVAMDERTKVILEDYEVFFKEFDAECIDAQTFVPWFLGFRHPRLKQEEQAVYKAVFKEAFKEPSEGIKNGLLRQLNDCKLAYDLQSTCLKWEEGDAPNFRFDVAQLVTDNRIANGEKHLWLEPDLEGMLDEEENEDGLHWPIPALELVCKPLRAGDSIILAARPGKGKTSFMAYLAKHWAKQLPHDRDICWFNNEGNGKRIYMRVAQAALETNTVGLIQARRDGSMWPKYDAALGRRDRLRVFNVQGMTTGEISGILEEQRPALIIFDMLNNVQLNGSEGIRSDERCEKLAQWARDEQVKHNSVGVSTWQVSVEGANMLYPPESALMNSKTAIQGACDGIIMLGALDNPNLKNMRGLSMPKTKMQRQGTSGDPHCELEFLPDTSMWREMQYLEEPDGPIVHPDLTEE